MEATGGLGARVGQGKRFAYFAFGGVVDGSDQQRHVTCSLSPSLDSGVAPECVAAIRVWACTDGTAMEQCDVSKVSLVERNGSICGSFRHLLA